MPQRGSPAGIQDPQPSTSYDTPEISLTNVRGKRKPGDGSTSLDFPPITGSPELKQFRQQTSEGLFSPTETLVSSSRFLSPDSPPANMSPSRTTTGPYAASFRNNSAVSLPKLTMPDPDASKRAHYVETLSVDKNEDTVRLRTQLTIRTHLPHFIVTDPPTRPKPSATDLPDHWRQFVRLDGSLYYYNPFERLVTTEDMHNARLRSIVEKTACKLASIADSNRIVLPADWELCIEIEWEDEEEVLHYNYISYEEGQYFQLGRAQPVCAERSRYWDHVEKFCMHHSELPPFAEADFLSELAYGATERILDNKGTTFRFTGPQTQALIGTYRELKEAQHEGIAIAPALIWLFARTMNLVEETRTNSKYGTADAAAARKSSWKEPTLKFRIIDLILGFAFSGTHNMYRRRLMKTRFNNVLYLPDFRELLSDLIIEWGDSNLLSTVFVAVNVSFLAINDLTSMQRTCSLVSSLFAMISIAGGMHHIWNHRIKLDVEVVEASQYMNHGIIFGDRGSVTILACFSRFPSPLSSGHSTPSLRR
ncbi:hypothetical protein BXZ70DRAFT_459049 [Cristinia sonorae]|uniref:WW domain-containing protein n=1 Tax=Cristinia sonorae TaxID=1940300 RepID=A0A8K0UJW8_9AGAR|nr:hypothetical protein BXZ70DRAFT_459049 [Cristinia sonorae]